MLSLINRPTFATLALLISLTVTVTQTGLPAHAQTASEKGTLSSFQKKTITLSVIVQKDIASIWSVMVSDPIISWTNLGGDCAARAARSCRQIEKLLGFTCAKAYTDCCSNEKNCTFYNERRQCLSFKNSRENYRWGYHVAPVFLVKNIQGETEPLVFDPGLSTNLSTPTPLNPAKWKSMLNPKGAAQFYYGNRYAVYGIDQSTLYKEDFPGMVEQGEADLMLLKNQE